MASTIFALSSSPGRAAVAVIRVSGPRTQDVLRALAGGVPSHRLASLRTLRRPVDGSVIDEALVLFFPGPHSYTGEDVAELQVHGSRAVVQALLAVLADCPGLYLAEPGAFTRRALENGRLDLAQVEGLADLIDSVTERQRQQALAQMRGHLSGKVEAWRAMLLDVLADLEAQLDFSDEGDVDEVAGRERAGLHLRRLTADLADALAAGRRGERLRDGLTIVIAGPPNAGKSTLLNALARRDVAIVSERPGTTRDMLEVSLDLDGYPLLLVDTAGLREATDEIEAMGIDRARRRAADADLVVWLSPADQPDEPPPEWRSRCVMVRSKIDSAAERPLENFDIALSALTGQGLAALLDRLKTEAERVVGSEPALVTRERQRLALDRGHAQIVTAVAGLDEGRALELVAEDVRLAARSLSAVLGLVDVEDVLGHLFSQFCIGK